MAWLADAQARLTVNACTPLGGCGSSETSRAMFGARTDGTTVPNTSAVDRAGVELGALDQLRDAGAPELDRGQPDDTASPTC